MAKRRIPLRSFTLLAAGFVAVAAGRADAEPAVPIDRTVVVLLIDGLAGRMIDGVATPSFDRLRNEGTWSHRFLPTFPSVSGPTWVSLSSGCWPEHHGVVTDKFFDPRRGLMDHAVDPEWMTGCELLHRVAERQGVKTAALGWWGQYSATTGAQATYVSRAATEERRPPRDVHNYLPDAERAAEIVEYLRMPDADRPRLVLGYFPGPDLAAHFTGGDSAETAAAVRDSDGALGRVLRAIDAAPFRERVTLIVTSDHGHVPANRIVKLGRILRRHGIGARHVTTGSTGFLYFDDRSAVDSAYRALSAYRELEVFRRSELPEWAHLGSGPRVGDLVVSARPGLYLADTDLWPWYLRPLGFIGRDVQETPFLGAGLVSAHGYAPDTPGVEGIFYAWGSGIVRGRSLDAVRMIDVHPTVARLLGIEPGTPVDGSDLGLK